MQVTLDGYSSEGDAEWVDSWADGLELLPPVDTFVLGGGMFPDYERLWATILDDPGAASDMLGRDLYTARSPTPPCRGDAASGALEDALRCKLADGTDRS